jgi:Fe-S oxidoreductase
MCFKFCDSFPILFRAIDAQAEPDAAALGPEVTDAVADACFQCKLCEVQCPYTPRDGHPFQLDVPRLIHRVKAQRAKRRTPSLRDRLLGDPDLAGRAARASLGVANALNRVAAHRWFLEKVLGVHREKLLPEFAPSTFTRWARGAGKVAAGPPAEAVLFPTCYVENNEPAIGRDTTEVLERNGVHLVCIEGLSCCGMPAWEHGDLDTLRARAARSLDVLEPFVAAGSKVVAINPTCTLMLRREWPDLLEGADRERARKLAGAVVDPCELLWSIRDEPRFAREVRTRPEGPIAYHAPCHLRAQAAGLRARDLFKRLFGAPVVPVVECCGHDGTYAMTVEGYEPSQRVGARAFEGMRAGNASTWATDCPLAAIQFQQHAGHKPLHPMSVLARAYRGEPFPRPEPAP